MTITIDGTNGITTPGLTNSGPLAGTTGTFSGLISANGGQIKFPATQSASSDANTLDDYEEGTFTPFPGITATVNSGSYTKIGRLVYIQYGLQGISGPTAAAITMTLPFSASFSGYQASESHFRVQTGTKLTVGQMEITNTSGSTFYLDNTATIQALVQNNCSFLLGSAVYYTS
jgi:hypothetical protein